MQEIVYHTNYQLEDNYWWFIARNKIVKELIENGADINKCENKDGFTPLYIAAQLGHINILNMLISFGADINICDNEGRSPLYVTSEYDNIDEATALINAGANVNTCCYVNVNPSCSDKYNSSPLSIATQKNYKNMVILLINSGAIIDNISLISASQLGNIDIVDILIKARADINGCDEIGCFPLMMTLHSGGHIEIVKLLIKNGADVNKLTNGGNSLLYIALHYGYLDIANILIKSGANIDKKCCNLIIENKNCICGKKKEFICSQCKVFGYCSAECQKIDWKIHKCHCCFLNSN